MGETNQTQLAKGKATAAKIVKLFATRRFCYYIPPDGLVEGDGYRVSIVFEHEPGHYPTGDWPYEAKLDQKMPWFWGHDYAAAVAIADESNDRIGIDKKTSVEIIASSMGKARN